jgi:hypothetical protein
MVDYNIDKPLRAMIASCEGPEDILDPFCFIIGFTSGELKARMAELFDKGKMSAAETKLFQSYQTRLDQLEKAWSAFVDEAPGSATPLVAGRTAQRNTKKRP